MCSDTPKDLHIEIFLVPPRDVDQLGGWAVGRGGVNCHGVTACTLARINYRSIPFIKNLQLHPGNPSSGSAEFDHLPVRIRYEGEVHEYQSTTDSIPPRI